MTTQNVTFFKKNSFRSSGFKSNKAIQKGQYPCRLIDVKPGLGKAYHGGETRDTLAFFFELESGAVVTRTVGASNHENSKCIELVSSMSTGNKIALDVLKSPEKLQEHILGLIGQEFMVEIAPSQCGRYSNIESVTPEYRRGA